MTYRVYSKIQIGSFFRFDRLRRWTAGDAVLWISPLAQHESISSGSHVPCQGGLQEMRLLQL
jgi:hypothetical protein